MELSMQGVKFGMAVLFVRQDSGFMHPPLAVIHTEDKGHEAAVKFEVVGGPMPYTGCTHTLFVSHDGYVKNPELWDDAWLKYDFIGAPWPADWVQNGMRCDKNRVGNMGFCLRSTNFIRKCAILASGWKYPMASDVYCCHEQYENMIAPGMAIKFAPVEVAARFSTEHVVPETPAASFGFHQAKK
jgi:hypothetical protein